MKVCIYGAGAIGGYIAGHLARAGDCEVSVVARGRTLEALQTKGLEVTDAERHFTVPVRAVADARDLGVQDIVFITVKSHQLDAALDPVSSLIGPETGIIPPTAGLPYWFLCGTGGPFEGRRLPRLDTTGRQWDVLPPSQVIGCPFWIGVHSIEPGVIERDGARANLPIGELDGSLSDRVRDLSACLESAGIPAPVSTNIHSSIWTKFVNAICWNPVAVLTAARLGEIREGEGLPQVVLEMMEEADRIGREIGVRIEEPPAERVARTLRGTMHKTSMLQDFEKGQPTEIEALYASLRSLTDLSASPTPVLDTVLALARRRISLSPSGR
jgi:2-dehydropantoate 2-reductase